MKWQKGAPVPPARFCAALEETRTFGNGLAKFEGSQNWAILHRWVNWDILKRFRQTKNEPTTHERT